MKDRNIICIHYARAGVCSISKRECHVFGQMQHCPDYCARKGSQPIRPDRRRQHKDRERRNERKWDD